MPFRSPSKGMPGGKDLVNLDDIVKKFVKSDEMEDMDKKLKIIPKKSPEEACFPKLEEDLKGFSNCRMLHTQNFTNNTCTEQIYSYKTSRKKLSACERSYQEGCKLGEDVGVKFKVPAAVLEVNVDLRQELSLMETERFYDEDELSWEVESQIRVPPKHRTVAELTINEKQYSIHFMIETTLKGDVIVDYKNLANGEVFSSSYINIATIINYAIEKKLLKADQFQVIGEEDAVRTRFKGTCKFSKGLGDIKVTETSLTCDSKQASLY
jgi:hypothetical protein